jgi:MraZ protein
MRMLNRSIFGSANDLLLDGQGRISLPASLRQYAQIEDVAAIVGVNDHIELWNPMLWDKERESSEGQMLEIMETLEAES